MPTRASGTFVVKLTPQTPVPDAEDPTVGRMHIDKQFFGDLEAWSKGQMISTMGEVKGSAGYVAIERVHGVLAGHTGTFALQHTGTMDRGKPTLSVSVVPDSGSAGLTGLTGRMDIVIEGGNHSYTFDYDLPAQA
jgi:hypothetical protein